MQIICTFASEKNKLLREMNNKIITYSLLAYIRNNSNEDTIKGSLDIFVPLVKRAIAKLSSKGINKGKNISEIKPYIDDEYGLDFPIPVLDTIFKKIAEQVNTEDKTNFVINNDKSFTFFEYIFDDYEEFISNRESEIKKVQRLFLNFKEVSSKGDVIDSNSIFEFIEKSKYNLSKYLSKKEDYIEKDYTIEAEFIEYFRKLGASYYEIIKDIYLGSIISCYIEYKPDIKRSNKKVELLLDTNFIMGLLDLNTKESTQTCSTVVKIAKNTGYILSVLEDTLQETTNLLRNKAENFDKSFLTKRVNPEDVFNACERRSLTRIDLEKIADNISSEIEKYGIKVVKTGYNNGVIERGEDYKKLRKIRETEISALHDAKALHYVKERRQGRKIKEFQEVNCWFVNNSSSHSAYIYGNKKGVQPEIIKADDLLNILWLSNPSIVKDFSSNDLSDIGLSSSISLTLSQNLPKSKMIRELEENIYKYANDVISDEDIVNVSKRITSRQLDIEEMNKLAEKENKEEFINRLNKEAKIQKDKEAEMQNFFNSVIERLDLETQKTLNIRNEKDEEIAQKNNIINRQAIEIKELRERERQDYIDKKIRKWKNNSIWYFVISVAVLLLILIIALYINQWKIDSTGLYLKNNFVMTILLSIILFVINYFTAKICYDRHFNHSNIKSFKENIKLPEKLK